jgi:hypothetical protein
MTMTRTNAFAGDLERIVGDKSDSGPSGVSPKRRQRDGRR